MATLFLKSRSGPPPASSKASLPDTYRFARRLALLLILLGAWYLRAHDPRYASAFMDESIYVLYGRMFLANHFEAPLDEPLHWSFGWYLWPAMAATADRLGGLAPPGAGLMALREMSAVLGMLTALALYGFARRVFSPAVGLPSAAVFALLGPAVFAFRIATRDAGAIFFFAVALWLYIRAWQEEELGSWLAAALLLFASFLCKYLVALYFPFLVLLGLRRWRQSLPSFALPLALLCAIYGGIYYNDLAYLLSYGRGYGSLAAPAHEAWKIYVIQRVDFWILLGFSLLAWRRRAAGPLWLGAAVVLAFQWWSRADYDYWKHVNYSLLFLVPLAVEGLLRLTRRLGSLVARGSAQHKPISGGQRSRPESAAADRRVSSAMRHPQATLPSGTSAPEGAYPLFSAVVVILLAISLGWSGNAWRIERFIFWPNVEPIAAYFEDSSRSLPAQAGLRSANRVLVDDSVLRYYFSPPLRQNQITDPFYFSYKGATGEPAYAAAVRDGYFDCVVLDGGMGEEARRMQTAIRPALEDSSRYVLLMTMPDPVLHQKIEIYQRRELPVAPASPAGMPSNILPRVEIVSPASNSIVQTDNKSTRLQGIAFGVPSRSAGWYVRAEVFTNRWYPQGRNKIPLAPSPVGLTPSTALRASPSALRPTDSSTLGPEASGLDPSTTLRAGSWTFSETIYLAGEGTEQCYHLVRVRLYDEHGQLRATAVNYGIVRAKPDGSSPACVGPQRGR